MKTIPASIKPNAFHHECTQAKQSGAFWSFWKVCGHSKRFVARVKAQTFEDACAKFDPKKHA
jgi:hypothetical protein